MHFLNLLSIITDQKPLQLKSPPLQIHFLVFSIYFLLKFISVLTFNCVDMKMVLLVIKNKTCRFMWNGSSGKKNTK